MAKRMFCVAMLIVILFVSIFSQDRSIQSKADDAFQELDDSSLTLRFLNALTGEGVPDARVEIENVGSVQTDGGGKVSFKPPFENGVMNVRFSREGFVPASFRVEIMAASLFLNRFSVSPNILQGMVRIVLDWDGRPKDLDAHLIKHGDYHISYRNMKSSAGGIATLDRDARDGCGPETITINSIDRDAIYEFFVQNYSAALSNNSPKLSTSKASITIYNSAGVLRIYQVPMDCNGVYWSVFRIVRGDIVDVNEVHD